MKQAFALIALVSCLAQAQVVPEREMEIVQSLYDTGKYAEASKRATESLQVTNFSDPQRVKLHELVGLSAFNLGDPKGAQASFLQLLRINPDYILDPFAVPPPAIRVFDQVRRENGDALNLVRQQIAIRAEQDKRAAAERERLQAEQEERRRKAEFLTSSVTVRTVEKRSMLLNFVPFGAGQFQQGRVGAGVAFAVTEGVMAILSVVSFFAIESLREYVTLPWDGLLTSDGKPVTRTVRAVPLARQGERDVWSVLKYSTGAAFYALWAVGIVDAVVRHEDEVVTERKETPPTARLRFFPTPGGLGAGVTIGF